MKKVLIITYYWPPSGGPGVQRVLKFVKYLPEFGWQPVVLTVENGNYPNIDESLLDDIPSGCRVYKTKIFEPVNLYKSVAGLTGKENVPTFVLNKNEKDTFKIKASKWIRANFFVPDAKTGWIKYIHKEGLKVIQEELPDLIFSSSPPHSLQIGAYKLAKETGLKWVCDFRDPWSSAFWQADLKRTAFANSKDKKLEKMVLSSCNAAITVSHSIAEMFYDICKNNYYILPNGYDDADFDYIRPKNDKFIISYTGTLGKDQYIDDFLNAVQSLPENLKEQIEISFYGNFHESVRDSVEKFSLGELIKFYYPRPHSETVKIMQKSDILLLVIPNTPKNEGILTGKLFEYMATGNFILGIGPSHGDASQILKESGCGKMFDFGSDLTKVLIDKITDWKADYRQIINLKVIKRYSRKGLTKQLASVFDEVV